MAKASALVLVVYRRSCDHLDRHVDFAFGIGPARIAKEGWPVNPSVTEAIEVSIVIPTYGRPDQLAACLDSLEALDYPRDRFEVIVVDDGSPQPLPPYGGALRVTLVRQAHAGPAAARNTGAAASRGRWLAFTDDDCRPAKIATRATGGGNKVMV